MTGILVCEKCEAVISGETTVGALIKQGDALQREGLSIDRVKLIHALDKYNEAWKTLKNKNGHTDCIKHIDNEYTRLYRSVQGSRA